jgi:hypothetical protein
MSSVTGDGSPPEASFLDDEGVGDEDYDGVEMLQDFAAENSAAADGVIPESERKRMPKRNAKSSVWQHFEIYWDKKYKDLAFCTLCESDVNYIYTMSTGMLTRHLRTSHRDEYNLLISQDQVKSLKKYKEDASRVSSGSQMTLTGWVEIAPTFEKTFTKWVVATYQPTSACEQPTFRAMCKSLNQKAPVIGREKVCFTLV